MRTQFGFIARAGQRQSDVEILDYVQDAAGRWNLLFDLPIAHDRYGSSSYPQQNGLLTHARNLDAPLRVATVCADNQNMSFPPMEHTPKHT